MDTSRMAKDLGATVRNGGAYFNEEQDAITFVVLMSELGVYLNLPKPQAVPSHHYHQTLDGKWHAVFESSIQYRVIV